MPITWSLWREPETPGHLCVWLGLASSCGIHKVSLNWSSKIRNGIVHHKSDHKSCVIPTADRNTWAVKLVYAFWTCQPVICGVKEILFFKNMKLVTFLQATWIESRLPSAAANPYLVVAAHVAAGIDGIKNRIEPPQMHDTSKLLQILCLRGIISSHLTSPWGGGGLSTQNAFSHPSVPWRGRMKQERHAIMQSKIVRWGPIDYSYKTVN